MLFMSDNPVADAGRYYDWEESQPYRCERCGAELHGEGYELSNYKGDHIYCEECILEITRVEL